MIILAEIKDFNARTSLWKLKAVNEKGQAKTIYLGNGMVKKRTYDQFGFLTKILDQTSDNTSQTALHLEYRFNAQEVTLEKYGVFRGALNFKKLMKKLKMASLCLILTAKKQLLIYFNITFL